MVVGNLSLWAQEFIERLMTEEKVELTKEEVIILIGQKLPYNVQINLGLIKDKSMNNYIGDVYEKPIYLKKE